MGNTAKLEIGDIVQLKSGGPNMIVAGLSQNGGKALVKWITHEGVVCKERFQCPCLAKKSRDQVLAELRLERTSDKGIH